ncbi:GGDEF domain-containing protein [Solidesulfovibrio sp.]
MDTRTIILLLAIGSFLFFLLLLLDQFRKEPSQRIPYWAGAKLLQAVGSLILFLRGPTDEFSTIASANTLLLLGCAYEAWAVCYLVGRRVGRLVHVPVALAIVAACLATFWLAPPHRAEVVFAVHTVFYALPAVVLLRQNRAGSLLRWVLGAGYLLVSLLFLAHVLWLAVDAMQNWQRFGAIIYAVMVPSIYGIMIVSGFSMLLLAKDKSDSELQAAQASLRRKDEQYRRRLELLSKTDDLTGIANRRHFDAVLTREYARHTRSGEKLSLILMDVDHFKAFNDCYGHVAGDDCLRRIGGILAANAARADDLAARYGGEEFACILPMTDLDEACAIAEQIRRDIEALAIPHQGSNTAGVVTASLGVATMRCTRDRTFAGVVAAADKLLYAAKSSGRNCAQCLAVTD